MLWICGLVGSTVRRPTLLPISLLELSGWSLERVRGSHHVFGRGAEQLVVPYRWPHVLAVYVREVLRRTKEDADD
jgi:predicted RNA binding protein YcfA (HicA-like mRNA interferase family)